MKLTGATRVLGIFGDPVAHSRSPLMQTAALNAAGLDAVYVPFHVTPDRLAAAVRGIVALDLLGVNLTIPHKETVCPLLDALDEQARLIGAVNTIVRRNGRLVGYNTDAPGLLRALAEDLAFRPVGQRVLLLGAGGAARAALVALAGGGAVWIGIVNRSPERACHLVREFAPFFPGTEFAALAPGPQLPGRVPEPVDLLLNTTAVGLGGESFADEVLLPLQRAAVVYDMVYGAEPTPLVRLARRHGYRAADGLGMLAGQGEEAFFLWHGCPPPPGVMRRSLVAEFAEK